MGRFSQESGRLCIRAFEQVKDLPARDHVGGVHAQASPEALYCYLRMFIVFCAYLQLLVQVLGSHGVVVVLSLGQIKSNFWACIVPMG